MKTVTIYSKTVCPYCDRAKLLLKNKGVEYIELNMDGKEEELKALKDKTGLRTVPQIFIEDHLVGGFTDLQDLEQSGELDQLLKG